MSSYMATLKTFALAQNPQDASPSELPKRNRKITMSYATSKSIMTPTTQEIDNDNDCCCTTLCAAPSTVPWLFFPPRFARGAPSLFECAPHFPTFSCRTTVQLSRSSGSPGSERRPIYRQDFPFMVFRLSVILFHPIVILKSSI
jgi:hypothetical protein